ncbi:hypothetical protein CBU02nite_32320 [Clostridium butyricum]|uniref:G-protein coupled receptors family 1 profile domain-containing protein n=1 Tax=Clostridium butyricum TaxID=1492 RepID=A0A512TR78_CLOBU|nr:hypothetical protein [Clostridium butyricum]NOW22111.1 glucan phosphoethanolaminetransferase (alkaline phosphatase superfamily) [Clostridium butyricum]GEQ22726.1 hypothetical protein CBU02nite_32320 [Clostridium butyricum]
MIIIKVISALIILIVMTIYIIITIIQSVKDIFNKTKSRTDKISALVMLAFAISIVIYSIL